MIEEIKTRRAIRKYQDKEVSVDDLEDLLKAAMFAPTARNRQEWQFYVTRDDKILKGLTEATNYQMFNTAKAAIVVCGDTDITSKEFIYVDSAASTQNILLEAKSLGLGTCWCAIAPYDERINLVKGLFKIKENHLPVELIAIGYPDEEKGVDDRYDPMKVNWL